MCCPKVRRCRLLLWVGSTAAETLQCCDRNAYMCLLLLPTAGQIKRNLFVLLGPCMRAVASPHQSRRR